FRPRDSFTRNLTSDINQQGAAANHATAPRRLKHLRHHHAAFGVSLPPASGSFLVLNGPRTLRALRHAPISSALSPNRYRTIPSSARTCFLISAPTAWRSALAPTTCPEQRRVDDIDTARGFAEELSATLNLELQSVAVPGQTIRRY